MKKKPIHSALFGVAIGDALGVPVEFQSRIQLKSSPVTSMLAYGSHQQPAGTWSDDSSLTFCLAEMLISGYNLKQLSNRFINWYDFAYWTPYGEVFDVGIATSSAIVRMKQGVDPLLAGGKEEMDNGNGSLMRILPMVFYVKDMSIVKRFEYIKDVSSLTHRHIRSILGCFIYVEYALLLLKGYNKLDAFEKMKNEVNTFLNRNPICSEREINMYHRILMNPIGDYNIKPIYEYAEEEISSSGYVVHSLEATLWCILNGHNFKETVLSAVNLGSDTDTTAAITGGLAGLVYGFESIPEEWMLQLARRKDIDELCNKLEKKLSL